MRSTLKVASTKSFLMCKANAFTTQGQPALSKCSNRSTRITTNDWEELQLGRLRRPRCWCRNSSGFTRRSRSWLSWCLPFRNQRRQPSKKPRYWFTMWSYRQYANRAAGKIVACARSVQYQGVYPLRHFSHRDHSHKLQRFCVDGGYRPIARVRDIDTLAVWRKSDPLGNGACGCVSQRMNERQRGMTNQLQIRQRVFEYRVGENTVHPQ